MTNDLLPLADFLLGRRVGLGENILALERQLEAVGDARHVVAAAGPPDYIQCPRRSEVADQALHVIRIDGVGSRRLLTGERESGTVARGKGRPIPAG